MCVYLCVSVCICVWVCVCVCVLVGKGDKGVGTFRGIR